VNAWIGGAVLVLLTVSPSAEAGQSASRSAAVWVRSVLAFPYPKTGAPSKPHLMLVRQDHETLQRNRSVVATPMRIGSRGFRSGLGTHAFSVIRLSCAVPMERLRGWIGVDANPRSSAGSVVFVVRTGAGELFRSAVLRHGQEPVELNVALQGVKTVDLVVEDGGDGVACDHADWADLRLQLADGTEHVVADLPEGAVSVAGPYPFSFRIDGKDCAEVLPSWKEARSERTDAQGRRHVDVTWVHPSGNLSVRFEAVAYRDFPALEWLLWFENKGQADSPLVEDVLPLDLALTAPRNEGAPYVLHRTAGGTPDPKQFEATTLDIGGGRFAELGAKSGRSSTQDFPFFKVDLGDGALVAAVGWSGNWKANVEAFDGRQLHLTAGMERTRFRLHPGERVRTPRILLLRWQGDSLEANARFRQLIYRYYAARRSDKPPMPVLFSNTCFTRGGGWLNECNAENQISLINAYAPLGLEAVITDAGWFEGGWPDGAGNWTPRKDAYPQGMGPVAAAAAKHGMVYGLWFEPERVVAGTSLHRDHPEWCLASGPGPQNVYLANFGLPEVQEHFFQIVKGFMDLKGFRVYRQDFNMDPLPYWRYNDAPDRQGMTEMLYIQGLYAFWDRLAATWPDSLREECASGGHRIDLETVMRFHMHQKTDYWFDNEVDQASVWSLSQYLPNSTFVAPIDRLDEYTFHSVFATSLCIGWIADAPEFPRARAAKMLNRYLALRHLLVGAYYPLTGYSRAPRDWMAMQFHRPDLDMGMILVFRRKQSPYRSLEVTLHGLDPSGTYEFRSEVSGKVSRGRGVGLMRQMVLALPEPGMSDILVYRRVAAK